MRRQIHILLIMLLLVSSAASVAHADPPLPLPRMPICGDQDGSEAPLVFRCPEFAPATDVQTYQVPGTNPVDLRFDFVFREATYNSELGYYLVDSASGAIDTLKPGDSGYLSAAMQRAQVIFPSGSDARTADVLLHLNGGEIIVFFIVQNATLASFLATNPSNNLNQRPLGFFAIDQLNPDSYDHLIGFTRANTVYTQFGFEDITGGGDRDYDDIVYTITPALIPLSGRVTLSPRSTRAQVAHAATLVATVSSSDGVPLSDIPVTITVDGVNPQSTTLTTDQSGNAAFTYTGSQIGQDFVVASAVVGDQPRISNTAVVDWLGGAAGTLYITNGLSDEVMVLDTASNTIVDTIQGAGTQGIVANREGSVAYSVDTVSNQVSVLDLAKGEVARVIPVGDGPVIPALNNDESQLYVTNFRANSISVIDTAIYSNSTTITDVPSPWAVAGSPDGTVFAVSQYASASIALFDAVTLAKIKDISVGSNPEGLIFHPNGAKLYVANLGSSTVSVIDTHSWKVTNTLNVGTQLGNNPVQFAFNADASRLYVADDLSGTASEIDVATEEVIRHMAAGAGPRDVEAVGQYLYVTNTNDDSVSVIDLNSGATIKTITGFHQPHSIASAASRSPTYVVSGRVIDHNGWFKAAVSISDGAGHTTTTDANGGYTLHGLVAGEYIMAARYDGYTFLPGTLKERTLHVPAANRLDFTAILEPLLFIPGITGSWLDQDGGIPPCGIHNNLWIGNLCSRVALNLDPSNIFRADKVIATDAIREITPWYQVYNPLLTQITTLGYREYQVNNKPELRTFAGCDTANQAANHPNLFVFAYDWRLDNAQNADLLNQYVVCIEQFYPNTRVNILTHSMGGLLARRYILDHPGKVDKLITIAAPWLGAPKAIMALETGAFLDPSFLQAAATQLSDAEVKKLIEFFPGGHQLLPGPAYFTLAGSAFGEQVYDSNHDGRITENYTYDQFMSLMNELYPRSVPGTTSFVFYAYPTADTPYQEDWSAEESSPQGVRYYHLYGVQDTPATIGKLMAVNRKRCMPRAGCRTDKYDVAVTNGDGTVPAVSAARSNDLTQSGGLNAQGATIARVNGLNKDVEHTALAKNQAVIDYVMSVLRPAAARAEASKPVQQSIGTAVQQVNGSSVTTATTTLAYRLRIDGIRQMTITDSHGNSASMTDDTLVGNIPNLADLHLGDASHMLIMPADQLYTVMLHSGTDPLAIDFTLRTDDTPTLAVRYLDLELPSNVNALLTLTPQAMDSLRYDADGDGQFETAVPPTAAVSGPLAGDVEAPGITLQRSGSFANPALTLTATDTGSGVKELFYSLDGEHFQHYSGSFQVNIAQTPIVYAFADDNVANRSGLFTFQLAPGGQPALQIYLPIVRR